MRQATEADLRKQEYKNRDVEDYEINDLGVAVRKDRWEYCVRALAFEYGLTKGSTRNTWDIQDVLDIAIKRNEDESPSLEQLVTLVDEWAEDKGILTKGTPVGQLVKTQEEVDELREALLESDREEIIDAIGDITITLMVQSNLQGLDFKECVQSAYDNIKKRNGVMVNGVFVKASDLATESNPSNPKVTTKEVKV